MEDILEQQIAYYRARAAEYDATFPSDDRFAPSAEATRAALRAFRPRGRVLEIAAGTGQWTGLLADLADKLVATDASPEMLELNRTKHPDRPTTYRVADAFALPASHDFDTVFFGFFLSHVPPSRFEAFWDVVDGVLAPGGRVFFVDEGRHFEWREDWVDEGEGVVRRPLSDGSVHLAVKVLWRPEDLQARLTELGWNASVQTEGPFYWGRAHR
ncbi:MAG TPA: class I SAM-dependent methyltransferase [Candidatus Limnocylindria bacterium]|nr:class I SAM-dependent methyltransferase [Candidatus Limnocylindria bacterium]